MSEESPVPAIKYESVSKLRQSLNSVGQGPIAFSVEPGVRPQYEMGALAAFEQLRGRIQKLVVSDWDKKETIAALKKRVERLQDITFPNMTSLVLETKKYSLSSEDPPESHILPKEFLNGRAPMLAELSLVGWSLPWRSSVLSERLTTLKMHVKTIPKNYLVATEFVQMLGRCTNLRELDLHVPLMSMATFTLNAAIPLDNMEYLSLVGTFVEVTVVLRQLRIPRSASIDLTCTIALDGNISKVNDFTAALNESWLSNPATDEQQGDLDSFHALYINEPGSGLPSMKFVEPQSSPRSLEISAWWDSVDFDQAAPRPDFKLAFWKNSGTMLRHLIDFLPLDGLESLRIEAMLPRADIALFHNHTLLSSVFLHQQSAYTFMKYLESDPSLSAQGTTTNATFFPNVKSISFYGVIFNLAEYYDNYSDDDEEDGPDEYDAIETEELKSFLVKRDERTQGSGRIERLSFRSQAWNLKLHHMQDLGTVVDDVDYSRLWDEDNPALDWDPTDRKMSETLDETMYMDDMDDGDLYSGFFMY